MSPLFPVLLSGSDVPLYIEVGVTNAQAPFTTCNILPLSEVLTVGSSFTYILAVALEEALAVKVPTVVPFFCIVRVALLTVGIVGFPIKSL